MKIINLLFLLLLGVSVGNCANILGVFFAPSPSHHMLGSALLKELVSKGHNITMVSPYPLEKSLTNYTDVFIEGIAPLGEEMTNKVISLESYWEKISVMLEYFMRIQETTLSQKTIQNFLASDSKFDVIVYDAPGFDVMLGFSHTFKAPVILFSPFGDMSMFSTYTGNYYPLSYLPASDMDDSPNLLLFVKRLRNVMEYAFVKYFPDAPPYETLKENIALTLINSHYTYETPRPYTPNVVQIGGFNMVHMKQIEPDLKKWLDEANEGIVFISFGSKIKGSAFDEEKLEIFVNAFSKLKQKVLWKFDRNDLKNVSKNVRVENWLPQKEILNHRNVKVFITHCGMGGVTESIYGGVPMIGMPFYGDQIRNVKTVVDRGYGIEIKFQTLTQESLSNAIAEIITNSTYYDKVQAASESFKNQPINPLDKAIYWIEHVIKFKGADHLKPASLKLSIFQEFLVDVASFLLITVSLVSFILYFITKKLFRFIIRRIKK